MAHANQKEKKQEATSNDEPEKDKSESRPMTDKSGSYGNSYCAVFDNLGIAVPYSVMLMVYDYLTITVPYALLSDSFIHACI